MGSTTLNRSFGYYILPRSRGLCTLCAIRVQFCRGEDFLCSIEVRTREDSKVVKGTSVKVKERDFDTISKKVEDAMKKASPDGKIVKDKEIVVTIESKEDPCLDYLDLPGLVSTGNGQDRRVKDIMELARDVLTKEYDKSIILLVVQAQNNGISNSAAAGLIEELDGGTGHYTSRTVGVLTKVDMFVPEDNGEKEGINNLLHGERIGADSKGERYVMRLENGWIGLGSRMSREITNHETLQTVDAKESAFFSSHEAYKSLWEDGKMGIMSLRDRLKEEYEKMIGRIWCPRVEKLARERFRENETKCCNLGVPFCNFPLYKEYIEDVTKLAKECDVPCHSLVVSDPCADSPLKRILLDRSKKVWRFPYIHDICKDVQRVRADMVRLQQEVNKQENESLSQVSFHTKQKKAKKRFIDLLRRLQLALVECTESGIGDFLINELVGKPDEGFPFQLDELKSDADSLRSMTEKASPQEQSSALRLDRFDTEDGLLRKWKAYFNDKLREASQSYKKVSDDAIEAMETRTYPATFTKLIRNDDDTFQLKAAIPEEEVDHMLVRLWIEEVTPFLFESDSAFIDTIDESMMREKCLEERAAILKSMTDTLNVIKDIHGLQIKVVRGLDDIRRPF